MRTRLGIIALVPLTLAAQEQASKTAPSGTFAYGHRTAVPSAVAVRRIDGGRARRQARRRRMEGGDADHGFQTDRPRRRPDRRRSAPRCASCSMTTRSTSARRCTTLEGANGVDHAPRAARRQLRFGLLRAGDRQLSRPSEPRVLRPESVRIEERLHRNRHVVLRQLVGSGVGGVRRTSMRTAGRRRSAFRSASSVSRATRCRRGGCRCAASSSGATSRTSGRGGGRRKRAGRRGSGISRGCACIRRRPASRAAAVRREQVVVRRVDAERSVQHARAPDAARRARPQGSADVEPHARRDVQSRLRPGRGRSRGAQPLGVRDLFSRKSGRSSSRARRCSTSAAPAATSAATSRG